MKEKWSREREGEMVENRNNFFLSLWTCMKDHFLSFLLWLVQGWPWERYLVIYPTTPSYWWGNRLVSSMCKQWILEYIRIEQFFVNCHITKSFNSSMEFKTKPWDLVLNQGRFQHFISLNRNRCYQWDFRLKAKNTNLNTHTHTHTHTQRLLFCFVLALEIKKILKHFRGIFQKPHLLQIGQE
jgi:hypothetical protein